MEEKTVKNAAPREGSGVPHLKLSLSALHWQQEQALASISSLIEEVEALQYEKPFHGAERWEPEKMQHLQPQVMDRSGGSQPEQLKKWDEKPVKPASAMRRYEALMQPQDSGEVKRGPTLKEDGFLPCLEWWCLSIVSHRYYDYVIGLLILINSVLVGVEVQLSLEGITISWMQPLDNAFIAVYCLEIAMRLIAYGWKMCFADTWFLLDFVLVVLGLITTLVLELGGGEMGILESVLVIRAMRLLRLIRALRMLKYFRTVWRLVYGLLTSHNAMFSTMALILLTLYIFACLGVELITKDDDLATHPDTQLIVAVNFSSVPGTMLTLMQFVTVDSVAYFYLPLIHRKPILALYFCAIVLIVSIALMNLVTAVLVEGALENAQNDKAAEKMDLQEKLRRAVPKLRQVFLAMDANGDGNVSLEEIEAVPMDVLPQELFEKSAVSSMQEIFEVLDVDGGGELSQDEFVDGLLDIFFRDIPLETVQTLKLLRLVEHRLHSVKQTMDMLQQIVQEAQSAQVPLGPEHSKHSESFRKLLA